MAAYLASLPAGQALVFVLLICVISPLAGLWLLHEGVCFVHLAFPDVARRVWAGRREA